MNTTRKENTLKTLLMWLLLVALFTASSGVALASEDMFPTLQIGTRVYTNATITTKAKTYVFLMHSTGMETIKVQDLPREVQQKLGYLAPDVPQKSGEVAARGNTATTAAPAAGSGRYGLGPVIPWIKDASLRIKTLFDKSEMQHLKEQLEARSKGGMPNIDTLDPRILYGALTIIVLLYLFFSHCSRLICLKAGTEPGVLIWLPGLQLIPLLRAARMSPAWILACLVPPLAVVAQVRWCLRIAKARDKSIGVGILLLVPVISLFAFLYLAFSDAAPDKEEKKPKSKVMILGAARV